MAAAGPDADSETARRRSGEETKALIISTALRLFRERGYDATTMRAIAAEAGVSVGNAYHYVDSKEHLIQAYYEQVQVEHDRAAAPVLASTRVFVERLRGTLVAWQDVAEPYHAFAGKFFKNAAEPDSPLSPFSAESRRAREASVALFARVVEGADLRTSTEVRRELPELLWLYHMGVVLFWVHDRSDGTARTRQLIDRTVPVIDRLARAARLPVLRPLARDLVTLSADLRTTLSGDQAPPATAAGSRGLHDHE